MSPARHITLYYLGLFLATGMAMPYLPVHFLAQGFSGKQVATISTVGAAMMVLVPPLWGYLADRTGRAARLLALTTTGWALGIASQGFASAFEASLLAMMVQSFFGSSLSSLADALAVAAAQRAGTTFARLRLWGSVAFILSSLCFGQALAAGLAPSRVVPAAAAAALLAALVAWTLPDSAASGRTPPTLGAAASLLRRGPLLLFFAASALHWASFSPFLLFLEPHLTRVGLGKGYVGPSLAIAVGAEVLGMRLFERLRGLLPLLPLLGLSFALNGARWWFMAGVQSGPVALALQLIHGMAYGVFFVGSVAFLEQEIPEELRSTGRALYGALVFGLGGMTGHQIAGWTFDQEGSAGAFRTGSLLELGALALLLALVGLRRAVRQGKSS